MTRLKAKYPQIEHVSLVRVRLNSGGYCNCGHYWGRAAPLYRLWIYDPVLREKYVDETIGKNLDITESFRARDRQQAESLAAEFIESKIKFYA